MADKPDNKAAEEAKKEEQKQANMPIVNVCTISLRQILIALHEKALKETDGKFKSGDVELTIQNSAIEGAGGKDAKFFGAGQHIIAAIPKTTKGIANNKVQKKDALPIIQTYIQWFVGPDIKPADKDLKPLEDGAEGKVEDNHEKKEDIEKSKEDKIAGQKYEKGKEEPKKESNIYVPSFSQYLLLEDGEDKGKDEAAEKGKEDKKAVEDKKDDKATEGGPDTAEAQGWYVEYKLTVPGAKEHTIADSLKKFGADLLKNVGIKFTSLFGGGDGKVHTVGDLLDGLDKIFGKMDPDEFQKAVQDEIKKRMKGTKAESQVWDTPTILKYLKKEVSKSKSKISAAKFAMCIKVTKDDPSYKLFNEDAVANIINTAIENSSVMRGLGKRLKGMGVKGKDVILVNNFGANDDKKAADAKAGAVTDSKITKIINPLIVESQNDIFENKSEKDLLDIILENEFQTHEHKNEYVNTAISLMESLGLDINLLLESGKHTAAHIKELIDKIGAKNITSNKDKIIASLKEYYSNNKGAQDIKKALIGTPEKKKTEVWDAKRVKGWNKKHPDDPREEGYKEEKVVQEKTPGIMDDFFKLSDEDSMKKWVDTEFGKIAKDDKEETSVQAFWKALSLLPEKEEDEKVEITFMDIDDPSKVKDFEKLSDEDKKNYNELEKKEKEEGKQIEAPEVKEKEGFKFSGWDPDPNKMEESGETYAKYVAEEKAIEIIFMDVDDPSTIEDFENLSDKDKQTYKQYGDAVPKEKDKDVTLPAEPQHEGFKFIGWTPDPNSLDEEEDKKTYAKYEKLKNNITFMDIEDPSTLENPEEPSDKEKETYTQFGDPIPVEDGDVTPPEDPKHDGFEFAGWKPDPKDLIDEEGEEKKTYSTYKAVEKEGKTFNIKIVKPDPEDPDNTKSQEELGIIHVVKGIYKVDELKKNEKNFTDADFEIVEKGKRRQGAAQKEGKLDFDTVVNDNEATFKKIENVSKLAGGENGEFKFAGWDQDIDEVAKGPGPDDPRDPIIIKATFDNNMKAKHTGTDFYIVPMKGLESKDKHKSNEDK